MSREQVEEAVDEIKREGLKAAVLHAVVESAAAFFVAVAALSLTGFQASAAGVDLLYPLAVLAAAAYLVATTSVLYRRRTVEQFEEVNPDLREKLRTARDAAEHDDSAPAAEALYREVLADLQEASSRGFVDGARIAGALVVVLALGVALMAGGVDDLRATGDAARDSLGIGGPTGDAGPVAPSDDGYTGVQSGDHLVGEPGNFSGADEELLLRLRGGGSPSAGGDEGGDSYYTDDLDAPEVRPAGAVDYYVDDPPGLSADDRRVVEEYILRRRGGG